MRTIYLHGHLREAFGPKYPLDVKSVAEAIRALCAMIPGFAPALRQGEYRVVRGSLANGREIGVEELGLGLGACDRIHLVPVLAGAKGRTFKMIAGVALMATGFGIGLGTTAFSAGAFGSVMGADLVIMGGILALGGAAGLLSPQLKSDPTIQDDRTSFMFNGPVNRGGQGMPVPLIYGEVITGSIAVNGGISTEDIHTNSGDAATGADGYAPPPGDYGDLGPIYVP